MQARVLLVLLWAGAFTAAGVAAGWAGGSAGLWDWPPQPSSLFGVALGLAAGGIVVFEMLYPVQKKWFRWRRRFGVARTWLRWHVWLGLACLPVVLMHAGLGFGPRWSLPWVTMWLFVVVTASGLWGLVMQQWVPQQLLSEVVGETVASEIDRVGDFHASEADRVVEGLLTPPPGSLRAAPAVTGRPADELRSFRADLVRYLRDGRRSRSPLASTTEAEARFTRLRDAVPESAGSAVERLRQLADLRRQWDRQARLQSLLHNWLLVHLPLSVAMTGVMAVHAVRALKYW